VSNNEVRPLQIEVNPTNQVTGPSLETLESRASNKVDLRKGTLFRICLPDA
jgi:hypothetical protein